MPDFIASLDRPPSGRAAPVWFDAGRYCSARLAGGVTPWNSPGELGAFASKAQSMFNSDALLVDLADLYRQQVIARDDLRAAMAARTRPGFALRTLLADEGVRSVAAPALTALVSSSRAVPVVLWLPSPARWLSISADQARSREVAQAASGVDPDHAESAAMYVADLLRAFAGSGIGGILLDEAETPAPNLLAPETYRAVLNVAEHYGWPVFIRTDAAPCWPSGAIAGILGWIGRAAPTSVTARWGIVASTQAWLDGVDLPDVQGGPALIPVPAEADPVRVMQRVRELH
jgi:hypothetical protein